MGERQEHHPPRFALISSLYRSIRKYHLLSFVRFHLCLAVASFLFWFLVSSQRSCGCGCTRPTKDLPTRSKARLGMIGARSFANFRFARRGHIHKPSSPQAHSTHFACIQPLSKSNTCPHCHTHTHIHTHTHTCTHTPACPHAFTLTQQRPQVFKGISSDLSACLVNKPAGMAYSSPGWTGVEVLVLVLVVATAVAVQQQQQQQQQQ